MEAQCLFLQRTHSQIWDSDFTWYTHCWGSDSKKGCFFQALPSEKMMEAGWGAVNRKGLMGIKFQEWLSLGRRKLSLLSTSAKRLRLWDPLHTDKDSGMHCIVCSLARPNITFICTQRKTGRMKQTRLLGNMLVVNLPPIGEVLRYF